MKTKAKEKQEFFVGLVHSIFLYLLLTSSQWFTLQNPVETSNTDCQRTNQHSFVK